MKDALLTIKILTTRHCCFCLLQKLQNFYVLIVLLFIGSTLLDVISGTNTTLTSSLATTLSTLNSTIHASNISTNDTTTTADFTTATLTIDMSTSTSQSETTIPASTISPSEYVVMTSDSDYILNGFFLMRISVSHKLFLFYH